MIYWLILKYVVSANPFFSLALPDCALEDTDCTSAEGSYPSNECPRYDTKQFHGKFPVMLELWGMRSTALLSPFLGTLWLEEVDLIGLYLCVL